MSSVFRDRKEDHNRQGEDRGSSPRLFFPPYSPRPTICSVGGLNCSSDHSSASSIPSIMAGLSCGEESQLAWDVLHSGANDFITIEDSLIGPTMRVLAGGLGGAAPMVGGESGVAGLAALIAVGADPSLAAVLGLDATSQVLLLGTEGAPDPEIYLKLVGRAPDAV